MASHDPAAASAGSRGVFITEDQLEAWLAAGGSTQVDVGVFDREGVRYALLSAARVVSRSDGSSDAVVGLVRRVRELIRSGATVGGNQMRYGSFVYALEYGVIAVPVGGGEPAPRRAATAETGSRRVDPRRRAPPADQAGEEVRRGLFRQEEVPRQEPPARRGQSTTQRGRSVTRDDLDRQSQAMLEQDYFQILEVAPECSRQELDRAYLQATRAWNPRAQPAELQAEAQRVLDQITEAYRTLRDPERRKAYEQLRRSGGGVDQRNMEGALRYEKALARLAAGDYAEAHALLASSLAVDPAFVPAEVLFMWVDAQRLGRPPVLAEDETSDRYQGHIARLDEVALRVPDDAGVYYYRGALKKLSGLREAAQADFQRALHIDPNHAGARRELELLTRRPEKRRQSSTWSRLFDR